MIVVGCQSVYDCCMATEWYTSLLCRHPLQSSASACYISLFPTWFDFYISLFPTWFDFYISLFPTWFDKGVRVLCRIVVLCQYVVVCLYMIVAVWVLQCCSVSDVHDCSLSLFPTGWRGVIGCLQSQVIFRKRATHHRALLQKMTYKDKAFYDATPPCTWFGQGVRSAGAGRHSQTPESI